MAVKRYKYSVTNKKYAAKGVVSSVCGGISAGVLCVASLCSLAFHGNGGIYLGAMGLAAFGISIYGFALGLKGFSEKHRDQKFCKIGSMLNGVIMIIWLALFLAGLS